MIFRPIDAIFYARNIYRIFERDGIPFANDREFNLTYDDAHVETSHSTPRLR